MKKEQTNKTGVKVPKEIRAAAKKLMAYADKMALHEPTEPTGAEKEQAARKESVVALYDEFEQHMGFVNQVVYLISAVDDGDTHDLGNIGLVLTEVMDRLDKIKLVAHQAFKDLGVNTPSIRNMAA